MPDAIELAKIVLLENSKVLYGIFGVIKDTGYFPPQAFLNEFFSLGYDPCDQDQRMECWQPFLLTDDEYIVIKIWWATEHPNTIESSLNALNWDAWILEIL
jgi:hypothetical protein